MFSSWWQFGCLVLFGLGVLVWPGSTVQAASLDVQLQAVLDRAAPAEEIPVIVTFRDKVDLATLPPGPRKARRTELILALKGRAESVMQPVRALLRSRGAGRVRELWIINGLAMDAAPELIRELAARPEVANILLDATVSLPQPEPAGVPIESNIALIGAPILWARGITGQNVVVATMDSGADILHADLAPGWRGGNNSWLDPSGQHPTVPFDLRGHGTGVLGMIVGGSATGNAIGAAPGAKWIAVKIYDDQGKAPYSTLYAGYQWLLDPDGNPETDDAPDVVNNSWIFSDSLNRCSVQSQEFLDIILLFKAADIFQVFAAGNSGPGEATSFSPANYVGSFVIGSVGTGESQTAVSDFSARGPSACDGRIYPDLVAPGYNVRVADLTNGGLFPTASTVDSGTSYAAPAVSGVIALLRSVFPDASVLALENALKRSALDVDLPGPDNAGGYGLVDAQRAFAALNALPAIIGTYTAGAWYLDTNGNGLWESGVDTKRQFGMANDIPVTGDWNGDGTIDIGVFRNINDVGYWYLDSNGSGSWDAGSDQKLQFGKGNDIPVAGDWNGDGITEVGVFRNADGFGWWYLDSNGNAAWDAGIDQKLQFGIGTDVPVPGDWNGDGVTDLGVYRNINGVGYWYLDSNGNRAWDHGVDQKLQFGLASDLPVTGDWNNDGNLDLGIYRAGRWYLDANGNGRWDAGDHIFNFGTAVMSPVTSR